MGAYPCGVNFPCPGQNNNFYRKDFKTINNPKINKVKIVYKDQGIQNFEFECDYQLLIEVGIKVISNYQNTKIVLEIPYNNRCYSPIIIKKKFDPISNEITKHFFVAETTKYFNKDFLNLISWAGNDINEMIKQGECNVVKSYLKWYRKKSKTNLDDKTILDQLKQKLNKIKYVDLNRTKIEIIPENFNEIQLTFKYVSFEPIDLLENFKYVKM